MDRSLVDVAAWNLPTLAWCIPLLGALFVFCCPKRWQAVLHRVTSCWMLLPFSVVAAMAMVLFSAGAGFYFEKQFFWDSLQLGISSLPITYHVGVDGISLPLLLLAVVLFPIAAMVSRSVRGVTRGYYGLLLVLQSCTLGALVAKDALLFFLFLEGTLLCMFFLIGKFGYLYRERAAFTYLIMGGVGSLFFLMALFMFLVYFESLDMEVISDKLRQVAALRGVPELPEHLRAGYEGLLETFFWLVLIGLAVKLPVVPFHTWMVRTHMEAPLPVVLIHSGVLLKLGAYGFYRFIYNAFPTMLDRYSHWLVIAGLVNLLYGAFVALSARKVRMLYGTPVALSARKGFSWSSQGARKIMAYASLSHMGIVLMGIGSLNSMGVEGSLYQLVGHGLTAAFAFLLILYLEGRLETTYLREWDGLGAALPRFAVGMRFLALALLGLPGLAGFVGEVLVFSGVIQTYPTVFPWVLVGFVLAAAYALRLAVRPTFGRPPVVNRTYGSDLAGNERVWLMILGGLILLLGLWPDLLLHWFRPVVETFFSPTDR
ncbi:complex I subunit 4 family protein [Pasteuria penetrans]|uniref:complex I subunit 4 family protein n=1 Tax=Pasteuria penetrans TaxID=86005 RepID=UPI000F971733|nr:NADH-quinone oxidoreductase subunit M [Pasteuria penetrans]